MDARYRNYDIDVDKRALDFVKETGRLPHAGEITPVPQRAVILDTARDYVTRDRAAAHGKAENTFAAIAALWSADLGIPIAPADVARLMVLFKMARAKSNPQHADNWIDGAGYAALAGELTDAR